MIILHDKNTQELIGEINEKQLQFLIDELVEEDSTDQDYYINRDQLDQFEMKGGDETLIQMLRDALGTKDDMDIIWTKSWTNDAQLVKIQSCIGGDSEQAAAPPAQSTSMQSYLLSNAIIHLSENLKIFKAYTTLIN